MAGQLTIDTLKASSGVLATQNGMTGVAKAWINFNGISGSVAIRSSFNVSSLTRNGTADYTIAFTTAMPDANYAWSGSASADGNSTSGAYLGFGPTATYPIIKTTSTLRVVSQEGSGTMREGSQMSIIVNGN